MSYVIMTTFEDIETLEKFVSWIDCFCGGSQPGRTCRVERAAVFMSLSLAENHIEKPRKKYSDRTFEIQDAPENSEGMVIGENYWIV